MNWILLLIAGLFEVGFTTCLGKAKETQGTEATYWFLGFFFFFYINVSIVYNDT